MEETDRREEMRADRETKEKNTTNTAGELFPSLINCFNHDD